MDQIWLPGVDLAADAFLPSVVVSKQRGMGKSINGALCKDEPAVAIPLMRGPQALFATRSEAGKVSILQFIPAQPQLIEVREDGVAVRVLPDHAGKPIGLKNTRGQRSLFLQVCMAARFLHPPIFCFNA